MILFYFWWLLCTGLCLILEDNSGPSRPLSWIETKEFSHAMWIYLQGNWSYMACSVLNMRPGNSFWTYTFGGYLQSSTTAMTLLNYVRPCSMTLWLYSSGKLPSYLANEISGTGYVIRRLFIWRLHYPQLLIHLRLGAHDTKLDIIMVVLRVL